MHQEHKLKHTEAYSYTFFSSSTPAVRKAQLISSPSQINRWSLFFFFKSENILFISWYKSLHCGTLLNMNLSFLNRGRAFQPCQKGTHCGSPEISKFLARGKWEWGGKKENCRPGFENECFLLAGSSLCLLLLRRVSQCFAINSREDTTKESFAFLPLSCCLHSVAVALAQTTNTALYVSG